ncbi:MAG: hypothetical protein K0Q53_1231 [Massilibacillus sp.]|jgi:hypothetical protein|nr:hypothetical protein [Massilibacillus sp.]
MINRKDGSIVIDGGYTLHSRLYFNDFSRGKYYKGQNPLRLFSLGGVHEINKRFFYVSLLFKENKLARIHLLVEDDSIKEWSDEPKRKIIHDELLKTININKSANFVWGSVSSLYDPKSAISNIIITYND